MVPKKWWALFAVTILAQVLAAWFYPVPIKGPFGHVIPGYVIPFMSSVGLVFVFGMFVLVSRARRTDVTSVERFARRLFFKESHPQ